MAAPSGAIEPVADRTELIRVLVVDDRRLLLDALASVLASDPSLHVVGTSTDPGQVPSIVRSTGVDVILADFVTLTGSDWTHISAAVRESCQ